MNRVEQKAHALWNARRLFVQTYKTPRREGAVRVYCPEVFRKGHCLFAIEGRIEKMSLEKIQSAAITADVMNHFGTVFTYTAQGAYLCIVCRFPKISPGDADLVLRTANQLAHWARDQVFELHSSVILTLRTPRDIRRLVGC